MWRRISRRSQPRQHSAAAALDRAGAPHKDPRRRCCRPWRWSRASRMWTLCCPLRSGAAVASHAITVSRAPSVASGGHVRAISSLLINYGMRRRCLRLRHLRPMWVLWSTQSRERSVRDLPWQADETFAPWPPSRSSTARGDGAHLCIVQCVCQWSALPRDASFAPYYVVIQI